MAEDLDDGEFWLPSHFLTDDDILMDFGFKPERVTGLGSGSGTESLSSNSDLELTSGSTETESDEDDLLLSGLTRKMTRSNLHDSSSPLCPVHHSKGMVLSSSPQSTLCGCVCNQGSSRESLSGPVSPPKSGDKSNNATLDLLNKAAGEVARLKMKSDNNNNNKSSTGTGFFDCSQKGILYPAPAPLRNPDHFPPLYYQPQFHHFPPMVWTPYKQQPQNRATKNNNQKKSNSSNNNNNNSNEKNGSNSRPLGLPPSAWPPLQLQAQTQAHVVPNGSVFGGGPKRECAGTGVFLPRRVNNSTPTNKSEGNNTPKTKTVKGPQSHTRRSNNRTTPSTTAVNNNNEIQLPQEWTY